MSSLEHMRRELREKYEQRREEARRKTMLRYYEPLPSPPPLVPRREELLPLKRKEASNPDLERYLVENIEDFAEQLVEMPEVRRKLEREIALVERILRKGFSGTEKIPYGRGSMVGARISFLRGILPGWEWDKETWLLTSPNRKITIHTHFTEISGDLVPHRDEIMEAMTTIKSVFLTIPVTLIMSNEPAALDLFKERAKPYADVLIRIGR